MLVIVTQSLYYTNDLLIPFALHPDGDRETTHSKRGIHVVILGDRLQVWDIQSCCRTLQYIREILCHESIETFQGIEAQNPVFRNLGGWTGWLSKVIGVASTSFQAG
jgi:hypothetical protein